MEGFGEGIGVACASGLLLLLLFFFLLGHTNRAADCQTCAAVCRPLPRALKARSLLLQEKLPDKLQASGSKAEESVPRHGHTVYIHS